ncbi:MAG: SMI1/KNR4 family protein [Lachnospiraceae bacterium]|nr:SMI1/KNR4 family protein [Lachnospiraceae bacterium]
MTKAEEYLTKLQEREPGLFPEPLQKSNLTDDDLQEIEKALGYIVPQQYREFLQSYRLSDMTVYIAFCGDLFACSFEETFSREQNQYVQRDWDNDFGVLVDMEWHNIDGKNADDWLNRLKELDRDGNHAFLKAGYIFLGEFYGYLALYDLVEGEVVDIHHEAIYDVLYELGIDDWDDMNPEALRTGMRTWGDTLCKDFNDFLRLVCLGEYYNENEWVFEKEEKA